MSECKYYDSSDQHGDCAPVRELRSRLAKVEGELAQGYGRCDSGDGSCPGVVKLQADLAASREREAKMREVIQEGETPCGKCQLDGEDCNDCAWNMLAPFFASLPATQEPRP